MTGLLGHDRALMLGNQSRDQFSRKPTGFLWVEVADLLRDIHEAGDHLVVALLLSLLILAPGTADLDRELLALRVADKLTGRLLGVLGGAGTLVDRATLFRTFPVTNLNYRC